MDVGLASEAIFSFLYKKLLSLALVLERLAEIEIEKMPTLEDY